MARANSAKPVHGGNFRVVGSVPVVFAEDSGIMRQLKIIVADRRTIRRATLTLD